MSEQLDIHNLTLESNEHVTTEEGDYRFKVSGYEIGYCQGTEKIPANTQQIIVKLEIPTEKGVVKVKNVFNILSKYLWSLRYFAESIGICSETGDFQFDVDKIEGLTGICHLNVETSTNGNDYNKVATFYSPSKAPTVADNDSIWQKYLNDSKNCFVTAEETPFNS